MVDTGAIGLALANARAVSEWITDIGHDEVDDLTDLALDNALEQADELIAALNKVIDVQSREALEVE